MQLTLPKTYLPFLIRKSFFLTWFLFVCPFFETLCSCNHLNYHRCLRLLKLWNENRPHSVNTSQLQFKIVAQWLISVLYVPQLFSKSRPECKSAISCDNNVGRMLYSSSTLSNNAGCLHVSQIPPAVETLKPIIDVVYWTSTENNLELILLSRSFKWNSIISPSASCILFTKTWISSWTFWSLLSCKLKKILYSQGNSHVDVCFLVYHF